MGFAVPFSKRLSVVQTIVGGEVDNLHSSVQQPWHAVSRRLVRQTAEHAVRARRQFVVRERFKIQVQKPADGRMNVGNVRTVFASRCQSGNFRVRMAGKQVNQFAGGVPRRA